MNEIDPKAYLFYTDGGCDNVDSKQGSYAWFNARTEVSESRYFTNTTSNIMEMTAVIEALKTTPEGSSVHIYSDSEYIIKGITEWIVNWKKKGWRNAKKEPVKNQGLWREMDDLCAKRHVYFHKVKGHSGVLGNEIADSLCNAAVFNKKDLTSEQIQNVINLCKEQYRG